MNRKYPPRISLGILMLAVVSASTLMAQAAKTMDNRSIEQSLKQIGAAERTLVLEPGLWTINQSVTIPANVNLKLDYGAVFDIAAGQTLGIDGPMEAVGLNPLFLGEGKVHFGPGYINAVYPQWWGKIDGKNDTAACQSALDSGAGIIRFPKAVYAIDAVGKGGEGGMGLYPASHTKLLFDPGAVLQAITTDKDDYTILNIAARHNVTIIGATIRGERSTHTGKGGEWGHGLRISKGSTHIVIKDCHVSDCWGDGIYLGEGMVEDVLVENSTFDNNRRNGCSITDARNVLFTHCTFSRSNGTSPFKGVDLEPNKPADVLQNIVFDNCNSFANVSGGFSVARDDKQDRPVSVTFRGCVSRDDGMGFGIDIGPSDCSGIYYISDCTVINPKEDGFRCTSANLQLKIDGLYIVNPNQKGETRAMFASGFVILSYLSKHEGNFNGTGNIDARNVYVQSDDGKALYALYIDNHGDEPHGFRNIDVALKTNLPAEKRFYKGKGPYHGFCTATFPDKPTVNATDSLSGHQMAQYIGQTITNQAADKDITLALTDPLSVSLDSQYTIAVAEAHKITLSLGQAALFPGNLKTYSSSTVGSRLTIRSDGKHWYVVNQVGSWK